ncbi:MAG: hypothetical protein K8I02_05565, partial [Candidatus Methylomirabilis sp.]|nr:hypothetical protein [Deltaproteobacteria bacterium]
MRRSLAAALLALSAALAAFAGPCDPWVAPPASHTPPLWPEWVLRPWVWLDEPAQQTALDLVEGYQSRDIPTGATILDAPWYTGAMTFEWDPALFPDPGALIDELHARDVRVFLWAVSMINLDSPNYAFALANDFFVKDLFGQVAVVEWWRGPGSFLDYTNPEAVTYWHSLLDGPLSLGIDGWKVDGTDPYLLFVELLGGGAYGAGGRITTAAYSDLFYRDFFEYTRLTRGAETAISARPYDSLLGLIGLNFAPRDVNHAGWVGDQDNNFAGLRNAMTNMLRSADTNSVNFGSDIGGYREPDPPNKEVFLRWAQYGALSPIMENGGGGEHRPW